LELDLSNKTTIMAVFDHLAQISPDVYGALFENNMLKKGYYLFLNKQNIIGNQQNEKPLSVEDDLVIIQPLSGG